MGKEIKNINRKELLERIKKQNTNVEKNVNYEIEIEKIKESWRTTINERAKSEKK